MAEPARQYTKEDLEGDGVTKKDLLTFLQANASSAFLTENKIKGSPKNLLKVLKKDNLVAFYNKLFETKAFRNEEEEAALAEEATATATATKDVKEVTEKTKKLSVEAEDTGPPKFTKRVIKKGDKTNFPKKGDNVSVFYKGTLDDGTVFDTNMDPPKRGKKPQALKFKVGVGKVIKGWDQGLLTMSVGEKAELVIEPEWAYDKKGVPGKVPPNSRLTFEVELLSID